MISLGQLCAQDLRNESSPSSDLESSLLWKIEGENLDQASYLFGTLHLISQEKFALRDEVAQAVDDAEQAVFELKLNDFSMLAKMQKALALPEEESLTAYLNEEEAEHLDTWLQESMSSNLEAFDHSKPLALYQAMFLKMLGEGTPASYDMHLLGLALQDDMEIFGLETLEDQMEVFDGISMREQVEWLLEIVYEQDSLQAMWDDMISMYLSEDLQGIFDLSMEESPEIADHQEAFLDQRNRNWIPVMEKMATEKSTFFAVGAAHLPGEEGVIQLLREAGYSITPIMPTDDRN
jgi:uncharacterized protein YbaP (TraB family)